MPLIGTVVAANREIVKAEAGAHVRGHVFGRRIQWDAAGIGNPVDGVEICDDPGGIYQGGVTERFLQRCSVCAQHTVVGAEHRFGEGDQCPARWDAAIAGVSRPVYQVEIVIGLVMSGAHTEQQCMRGGSIKTSIERRDPSRQELDLGARNGAAGLLTETQIGQVLRRQQLEEMSHCIRH